MLSVIKIFSSALIAQLSYVYKVPEICQISEPVKIEAQRLQIKKDVTTFIKLKSLSTSGYVWTYSVKDSSIIKVEKKDNEFPAAHPKRVGDSGMEVFAVTGLKSGRTQIFFKQKRPWKNGGEPVKNINYIVKVDK